MLCGNFYLRADTRQEGGGQGEGGEGTKKNIEEEWLEKA